MPPFSADVARGIPASWAKWIVLTALVVAAAVGWIGVTDNALSARWDNLFLDAYSHFQSASSASDKDAQRIRERSADQVALVDIDDISLAAVGQWPWPRYRVASLITQIAAEKPAAIGLDILFPEPDRSSLDTLKRSFKRDFNLDIGFTGVPQGLTDNDGYLGEVLGSTGAVGARYFYFDHVTHASSQLSSSFQITGDLQQLRLSDAPGVLDNTYEIAAQLHSAGFINSQADRDGLLRRVPMLIRHNGVIYPHLALATVMQAMGIHEAHITKDPHGPLLNVGSHAIPIDAAGNALIQFAEPSRPYPSVSALDLINRTGASQSLAGKTVFVGSSAAALNDLHNTLFDPQLPGLRVQAAIAENIWDNAFLRIPVWSKPVIFAGCVLAGLGVALAFVAPLGPFQLALGSGTLIASLLGGSAALFFAGYLFVSPAFPIVTVLVLFGILVTARFGLEKQRAKEWLNRLSNAQQVAMESMAAVAETRDPETGAHIKRTQHYAKAIAHKLRELGYHRQTLTDDYIELLFHSAPLHDIGKVGVPDHILLKPGPLNADEWTLMKKHTEYGRDIIASAVQKIQGTNFLTVAGEIALCHHERWDGKGYPASLAGEAIPLSARIMTVADVYDALISRRCYKEPIPHETAMDIMRQARGKIFDPTIADIFFGLEQTILNIANTHRDEAEIVLGDR